MSEPTTIAGVIRQALAQYRSPEPFTLLMHGPDTPDLADFIAERLLTTYPSVSVPSQIAEEDLAWLDAMRME